MIKSIFIILSTLWATLYSGQEYWEVIIRDLKPHQYRFINDWNIELFGRGLTPPPHTLNINKKLMAEPDSPPPYLY